MLLALSLFLMSMLLLTGQIPTMVGSEVGKEDGQWQYLDSDNKMLLGYRLYTHIAYIKFIVWCI